MSHDSLARSAYIHIPFCAHHCGYCNFAVVAHREDLIDPYLQALEKELQGLEIAREVDTLYLGGGTPTQLPPEKLTRLFTLLQTWLPLAAGGEFTVEANPEDFSHATASVLQASGVNRVSLGVQSFQDQKLRSLDRRHTSSHVRQAIDHVRMIDADLAIDLMFAAPEEPFAVWHHDLTQLLQIRPEHCSTYGLTWEKGTRFWSEKHKGKLHELQEGMQREMYLASIELLSTAGYQHYEVSNFALPGKRSRHNQVYWQGLPFYGFGPGAARYLNGTRSTNHRSTTTYIQRLLDSTSALDDSETLDAESHARERLVFALRMLEGINISDFLTETGFSVVDLAGQAMDMLLGQKLLELDDGQLRLTRKGLLVSDAIWPYFLREDA